MNFKVLLASITSVVFLGTAFAADRQIEPLTKEDKCPRCNMFVTGKPGAKAEMFLKGDAHSVKFCSVKCGFVHAQLPENNDRVEAFYVSNFGDKRDLPYHEKMLKAEDAYYVSQSDVVGAMGKTILPFASKAEAEAFMKDHGGKLLTFKEVTPEELAALKGKKPMK